MNIYYIKNLRSWWRLKISVLPEDRKFLLLQILVKLKRTWHTRTKNTWTFRWSRNISYQTALLRQWTQVFLSTHGLNVLTNIQGTMAKTYGRKIMNNDWNINCRPPTRKFCNPRQTKHNCLATHIHQKHCQYAIILYYQVPNFSALNRLNIIVWLHTYTETQPVCNHTASHKFNPSSVPHGYKEIHTLGHVWGSNRCGRDIL